MGLEYKHLNEDIRRYMLEEIEMDQSNGRSYLSKKLHDEGCERWPIILREAAQAGTDDTLAAAILSDNCLKSHLERRNPKTGGTVSYKMPSNAAQMLAEGEFNRFYIRALCRFAIDNGIHHLIGCRARYSENPRSSSEEAVGNSFDPSAVLEDLRTAQGEETALRMPGGPNSGICLTLP